MHVTPVARRLTMQRTKKVRKFAKDVIDEDLLQLLLTIYQSRKRQNDE